MSEYRSLLEFMDLSPEEHLGIKIHELSNNISFDNIDNLYTFF